MGIKVAVLGAGAWGTAFSTLLTNNDIDVMLWSHEPEVAQDIAATGINKQYFPNFLLPRRIIPTCNLREATDEVSWIFQATPVKYVRSVFEQLKSEAPDKAHSCSWALLSKGIEQQTFFVTSQILEDVFGKNVSYAVIGGPTFAVEVAQQVFTATMIASKEASVAQNLAKIASNSYFKPYLSSDPLGVQIGGAIKNIVALALGICQGAGYGHENTSAYIVTKGLYEVAQIIQHYGGVKETAYGLAGLGDLVLTCTGTHSKNMKFGRFIGVGGTLLSAEEEFSVFPEGFNTVQAIYALAKQEKLNLPLCIGVYEYIFQGRLFEDILKNL